MEAGSQLERADDGVESGLEGGDLFGGPPVEFTGRRRPHVEVLAQVQLDTQLIPDGAGPSVHPAGQLIGVDVAEIADQDGHPLPVPSGFAVPAPLGQPLGVGHVHRGGAAPGGRVVHDVVVDQGEHVEELKGGTDADDHLLVNGGGPSDRRRPRLGRLGCGLSRPWFRRRRFGGPRFSDPRLGRLRPGRASPRPVTEAGPKPLAPAHRHAAQLVDRLTHPGIDGGPVAPFPVQHRFESGVDLLGHRQQMMGDPIVAHVDSSPGDGSSVAGSSGPFDPAPGPAPDPASGVVSVSSSATT